ncbi:MAG: flagellar basal body rod C-terminal domain-containing protein [Rubricella sp.]
MQGYIESSNVSAVSEITRMIEVQRSYEQGMRFLQAEDDRIRAAIRTLGERR